MSYMGKRPGLFKRAVFAIPLISVLIFHCFSEKTENFGIFGISRIATVAGQDGCTPVPLGNGTVLWTFGDTILGTWKRGLSLDTTFEKDGTFTGLLQGSAAFTDIPDDENVRDLKFRFITKNGKPVEIIGREKGDGRRYWTVDGLRLGNSVFLYYMIMDKDPSRREFPFRYSGMGLARWDMPVGWKPPDGVDFRKLGTIFNGNEASYGDSVIEREGYLYLAGHLKNGNEISISIAKVRPEEIERREAYLFLTATGTWSGKSGEAARLFTDILGEPSLSYNENLQSYVIIYCGSGGKLKLVRFSDFSGLLSAVPSIVYEMPGLPEIKTRLFYFYYSGKEVFSTPRAIYAVYMNPAIYQPILVKIPYGALGR